MPRSGAPPEASSLGKTGKPVPAAPPPQHLCRPGCPPATLSPRGLDGRLTPKEQTEQEVQCARLLFLSPFFFFFLNLNKQILRCQREQRRRPETREPAGGDRWERKWPSAGARPFCGARRGGGELADRTRTGPQPGRHTAVRVGVLGWSRRSVLHSQPAKSTSSTSDRLMKV